MTAFFSEILARLPLPPLLFLSATGVVVGDYFAKSWSIEKRGLLLYVALAGYLASGIFYIPSLLKKGLVITSAIWSLISIIGFLLIGLILFGERLSVAQSIGVIIGVVSLVILAFA